MSIRLDDKARDEITTANGKRVLVDTQYVPFPFGYGYETMVFRVRKDGSLDAMNPLDKRSYGEDKESAEAWHTEYINKYIKATI